jgi:hypothetical protein
MMPEIELEFFSIEFLEIYMLKRYGKKKTPAIPCRRPNTQYTQELRNFQLNLGST